MWTFGPTSLLRSIIVQSCRTVTATLAPALVWKSTEPTPPLLLNAPLSHLLDFSKNYLKDNIKKKQKVLVNPHINAQTLCEKLDINMHFTFKLKILYNFAAEFVVVDFRNKCICLWRMVELRSISDVRVAAGLIVVLWQILEMKEIWQLLSILIKAYLPFEIIN